VEANEMHQIIEAVYDNGEFFLEELPPIRKARVFITFVQELEDNIKEKTKFPTKKLGKIKNLERGDFYGEFLSDRYY
jgi:predicted DNA-binding antitoxin AbrB/MazE fold protein